MYCLKALQEVAESQILCAAHIFFTCKFAPASLDIACSERGTSRTCKVLKTKAGRREALEYKQAAAKVI